MEYASCNYEPTINEYVQSENDLRHVGWTQTILKNNGYKMLYSQGTVEFIQKRVMEILSKKFPNYRPIMPTQNVVVNALSTIYNDSRPGIGDMYTRFHIVQNKPRCDPKTIIFRTINTLAKQIMNEYEIIENNKKLTKWTTLLGDFNEHGLLSHSKIKLKERRPQTMMFNMNY